MLHPYLDLDEARQRGDVEVAEVLNIARYVRETRARAHHAIAVPRLHSVMMVSHSLLHTPYLVVRVTIVCLKTTHFVQPPPSRVSWYWSHQTIMSARRLELTYC